MEFAGNGLKWMEMDGNGNNGGKWLNMAEMPDNCYKLLERARKAGSN